MFKKIITKCKLLLLLGRYNYPTGAFLLMWPCYWGTLSSINTDGVFYLLFLFSIGSFVMRGAGCCINDILDKKIDKKVERTKNRPLANNKLSSKDAIIFIAFQSLIGFFILLQLNYKSIFVCLIIVPFVLIYPLLKRYTYFPQFLLGLIFNWGVIVGHLAHNNSFNQEIIFLYLGGVFLTISYDTIYGFQDIEDDKKIGVKSLSIKIEKYSNEFIFTFYLISFIFFTIYFSMSISNLFFKLLTTLVLSLLMLKQFLDFKRGQHPKKIFDSNIKLGFLLSILIYIQNYL